MKPRWYYIVRGAVRAVFWLAAILAGLWLFRLFAIGVWALQF